MFLAVCHAPPFRNVLRKDASLLRWLAGNKPRDKQSVDPQHLSFEKMHHHVYDSWQANNNRETNRSLRWALRREGTSRVSSTFPRGRRVRATVMLQTILTTFWLTVRTCASLQKATRFVWEGRWSSGAAPATTYPTVPTNSAGSSWDGPQIDLVHKIV